MKGKSNISGESIDRLAKAMKLNKEESHFFRNLVMFNQSSTSEEKGQYSKELLRSRSFKKVFPLREYQYHYFDQWYFPVVRGLVALKGFKEDPEWIARHINPPVSPAEVKRALEELQKLGLLARDAKGKLIQTEAAVTTADAITSSSLAQYHREMAKKAAESIDRVPRDRRDLSALTLQVSPQTTKKIKELAEKFRQEVVEAVAKEESPSELYQMNIYIFPVGHTDGEDKK